MKTTCPCCNEPVELDPPPEQWSRVTSIASANPKVGFMVSLADHRDPQLWLTGDDGGELFVDTDGRLTFVEPRVRWAIPGEAR